MLKNNIIFITIFIVILVSCLPLFSMELEESKSIEPSKTADDIYNELKVSCGQSWRALEKNNKLKLLVKTKIDEALKKQTNIDSSTILLSAIGELQQDTALIARQRPDLHRMRQLQKQEIRFYCNGIGALVFNIAALGAWVTFLALWQSCEAD